MEEKRKLESKYGNKFLPFHGDLVNQIVEYKKQVQDAKYLEYRRLINDVSILAEKIGMKYNEITNSLENKPFDPLFRKYFELFFIREDEKGNEGDNVRIYREEFLPRCFKERSHLVKAIPPDILQKSSDFPRFWKFFYGIRINESILNLLRLFVPDISSIDTALDIVQIISLIIQDDLTKPLTNVIDVIIQCSSAESRRTSLLSGTSIEAIIEYIRIPNSLIYQYTNPERLIMGVYETEEDLINSLKKDEGKSSKWGIVDELIKNLDQVGSFSNLIYSFIGGNYKYG